MATRKVVRSAKTGQFVPKRRAKTNPSTTVTETVKTTKRRVVRKKK
jgi:hypothetical protein